MIWQTIVEGPVLYATFLMVSGCLLMRSILFGYSFFKKSRAQIKKSEPMISLFVKALVPFHRLFTIRPIYTLLRYLFHICLIVVPLGFAGPAGTSSIPVPCT